MSEPTYPFVACGPDAEERALGYAVCRHVAREGRAIAMFEAANAERWGQVLCEPCAADDSLVIDAVTIEEGVFLVMCARCVERAGWSVLQ